MAIQNIKQFNAKLTGFKTSMKTQRDNLQELLVYGFGIYGSSGNTSELSTIVNVCQSLRTVPTKTVQKYIEAHANIRLVQGSNGDFVFKKAIKGEPQAVKELTKTWYDWEGNDTNDAGTFVDPVALLQAAMKKIYEASKAGTLVSDRVEQAAEWLRLLEPVTKYEAIPSKKLKEMAGTKAALATEEAQVPKAE